MCRFLSKLPGYPLGLKILYCCCTCVLLLLPVFTHAQVVAIDDPIGRIIPSDSTENGDPDDPNQGTELSSLTSSEIQLIVSANTLNIHLSPDNEISRIRLYTINGQMMVDERPLDNQYQLPLSAQTDGIVVLLLESQRGIYRKKLLLTSR